MPLYEYECPACSHRFSHLWRSLPKMEESIAPNCPACGQIDTVRLISQVTVLGTLGGLTPTEQAGVRADEERRASITPREQINSLQAARGKTDRATKP